MAGLTAAPAEKQYLLAEVLRASGSARLRVTGSSMLPTIWPGDVAVLERADIASLRAGDLILFQEDSRLYLHRIVALGPDGDGFVTRGDAMPQADPVVRAEQILAKASAVERNGESIRCLDLSISRRIFGRVVAHFDLAGRIAQRLQQFGRERKSIEAPSEVVCEA